MRWWTMVMVGAVVAGCGPAVQRCMSNDECTNGAMCVDTVCVAAKEDAGTGGGGGGGAATTGGGTGDAGSGGGGGTSTGGGGGTSTGGGGETGGGGGGGSAGCTSGTVCRPSVGACDEAELCDNQGNCPADVVKAVDTLCRGDAGVCDFAERCDGVSGVCPSDAFVDGGVPCRSAAGDCDDVEFCSGSAIDCPADQLKQSGTSCRSVAGDCDLAEQCDGVSPACPADLKRSAGTECRTSAGDCDVAEQCDGTSATCPADLKRSAGTECRTAAGDCDVAEQCDGTSATCPANSFRPSTHVCRNAAPTCDVPETCSGSSATCPGDSFASSSVSCQPQSCSNGTLQPARFCAGTSASCNFTAMVSCNGYQCNGTNCRTNCSSIGDCVAGYFCNGSQQCEVKRANGQPCSNADNCSSGVCTASYVDADGDTYGAGAAASFCGPIPSGRVAQTGDCCDSDANARPGQTGWFTTARIGCGGYDYDCSGGEQRRYTSLAVCTSVGGCATEDRECQRDTSTIPGWKPGPAPGCGGSGTLVTGCAVQSICTVGQTQCNQVQTTNAPQECR